MNHLPQPAQKLCSIYNSLNVLSPIFTCTGYRKIRRTNVLIPEIATPSNKIVIYINSPPPYLCYYWPLPALSRSLKGIDLSSRIHRVSFFTTLGLSLYFYATPVGSISWAPECSRVFWPSGKDLSCTIWPQSGVSEQVFCLASAAFDKIEPLFKYLETLPKKKRKNLDPQVRIDSRWFPVFSRSHHSLNEVVDTLIKLLHFLI